jgi:hypothetical protein
VSGTSSHMHQTPNQSLQPTGLLAVADLKRWAKKMTAAPQNVSIAIGYRYAKKALRFSAIGLIASVLHFPVAVAAAFMDFEWLVRIHQIAIVLPSAAACWFAAVSVVKMEEKTWLACVVALLALVELVFGAKMLTYEFHSMTL